MNCARCGTANAEAASFCSQCGGSLTGAPGAPGASQAIYSGFWLRFGAFVIDQVILTAAYFVLVLVFAFGLIGLGGKPQIAESIGLALGIWIVAIVGPWLYDALLESSPKQATVGKIACGIKVTDLNGERISFGRATGRHFAEWITGFTMLIGYVMAAFTRRRQTLHDLIAGTVVVPQAAQPSQVAASPPAGPVSAWTIAGIVLAGMLVPAGIVAAIAIPAYQDYTIRAQVSEGLMIAQEYKAAVHAHLEVTGSWPADDEEAGFSEWANPAVQESAYVRQVQISNGTITITYGKKAGSRIARKRLSLRPYVLEDGDVAWQCGNAQPPEDGYTNSAGAAGDGNDSDAGRTSIADKHLPPTCRSTYVAGSDT
jgi:uncharacterized RDD family membrane protein YckC/Tfp pilus assembly major pilin PilA